MLANLFTFVGWLLASYSLYVGLRVTFVVRFVVGYVLINTKNHSPVGYVVVGCSQLFVVGDIVTFPTLFDVGRFFVDSR